MMGVLEEIRVTLLEYLLDICFISKWADIRAMNVPDLVDLVFEYIAISLSRRVHIPTCWIL